MKQKKQLAVLLILMAVASGIWYFGYFREGKSSGGARTLTAVKKYQVLGIDNPSLHWPELDRARKTEYKTNGRNPFSTEAPPPPSVVVARNDTHRQPIGPMQAPPPPLPTLPGNLKFFGYGTVPNGTARRAFFSDGEDVFIVSEGETLLGRYRIVKVNNNNLEFEEIATGRRNTTPLIEEPASGLPAS